MEMISKPNYKLIYNTDAGDDNVDGECYFNASNDDKARELAFAYIQEKNQKERQKAKNQKRNVELWFKPLSLSKLNYVVREVIEKTSASLEKRV